MVVAVRLEPDWKEAVYERAAVSRSGDGNDMIMLRSMEEVSQLPRGDLLRYLDYCKKIALGGRPPWGGAADHVEWLDSIASKAAGRQVSLLRGKAKRKKKAKSYRCSCPTYVRCKPGPAIRFQEDMGP